MPLDALARPVDDGLLDSLSEQTRNVEVFDPISYGMLPVGLGVFTPGRRSPADLFIPLYHETQKQVVMSVACRAGQVFLAAWRERLLNLRQSHLYVARDQARALLAELLDEAGQDLLAQPLIIRRARFRDLAMLSLNDLAHAHLEPAGLAAAMGQGRRLMELFWADREVLAKVGAILRNDPNLYCHSVNVSMVALALGRFLELGRSRSLALGLAGLVHDLGRFHLPAGLWEKPGLLSPDELNAVQRHPDLGHDLLRADQAAAPQVLLAVRHHHENADGSGYPAGLTAASTPLLARLLRLLDAYDAMTSHRPHRRAMPAYKAVRIIMDESERLYGRDLTRDFVRFLSKQFVHR
ncbi:MAG: HD domain-containing phosphohydrolase [Pseudomonadota bacterium]